MSLLDRGARIAAYAITFGAVMAACGGGGSDGDGGDGFAAAGGTSGGTNTGGGGNVLIGSGGSTSTGGATGTGGGVIGLGGMGTGGGLNPDAACASSVFQGERVPLDMYIMMDKSGSMGSQGFWDPVRTAITDFVNAPESAGIGVGIQFFPKDSGGPSCSPFPPCAPPCVPFGLICVPNVGGGLCDPNDYLPPAVTIQPLPGAAPLIVNAMGMQMPGGGTPTVPAMQSALQAAGGWAQQFPGRKIIIVLATDGSPNDCNSSVQGVAQIAAQGANATPSVQTFVIGMGAVAGLDQIAMAGGTGSALIVDPASGGQDFLDAMNQIRGQALGCDFGIEAPAGEMIDPSQVNVLFTPPGQPDEIVPRAVAGAADCDPAQGGWYYDNPTAPTQVTMCPASCDRVVQLQGTVQIQLGCQTVTLPPR